MDTISTIDTEQFKNSVFITISIRGLPFQKAVKDEAKLVAYLTQKQSEIATRKALGVEVKDESAVSIPGNVGKLGGKSGIKVVKPLIVSPAFDALKKHLSDCKCKITNPPQYGGIANPSGIMEGLYELHKDLVERVNSEIEQCQTRLLSEWTDDNGETHPGYLTAAIADYAPAIERARTLPILDGGLGPLFNAADYPTEERVIESFGIDRRWIALGVPEGLPPELRQQAAEELKADLRNAADEIKRAMRQGFLDLLEHARDTLTVKPGDKPKIFKDSCIGNVLQFCEVFNLRNTQGDHELQALVSEAKLALVQLAPGEIRKDLKVRDQAAQVFSQILGKVDAMIENKPGRLLDLGDD